MNAKMIGATISALRKRSGLTQAELAEKLNISNKTISKWENGVNQPDISALRTICQIFGISTEDFLYFIKKFSISGCFFLSIAKKSITIKRLKSFTKRSDSSYD